MYSPVCLKACRCLYEPLRRIFGSSGCNTTGHALLSSKGLFDICFVFTLRGGLISSMFESFLDGHTQAFLSACKAIGSARQSRQSSMDSCFILL